MEPGQRVVNFAAGPAKLPLEVLKHAAAEMTNYAGCGMGVMELSHRGAQFAQIITSAERQARELLHVPENYEVLMMQGGGSGQFSAVALNLMGLKPEAKADYIVTGTWSAKAAKEAEKYGKVNLVLPKTSSYTGIPSFGKDSLSPDASYVYYCANETIHGIEFQDVPDTGDVPLVCDMSSNIMSRTVDVSKFGLIFAGAQKNIGCAGVTVVIIRKDLIGHAFPYTPVTLCYKTTHAAGSLYNTPPAYSIYIMDLVFSWIKQQGGVEEIEKRNIQKAQLLYNTLDNSDGFYSAVIEPASRSRMNIPFRVGGPQGEEQLEKKFIEEATKAQLLQLKGHRSVGGMRASLYNAMSLEETQVLVDFMQDFRERHSE